MPALLIAILLGAAGPSPAAVRVLRQHQCSRCHEVEGIPAPPTDQSCAGCHIDISGSAGDPTRTQEGRATYGPAWDRFVTRTGEHYTHLPSLTSMGRFQSSWLRTFLLEPYDLRPNLSESMIRGNLTEAEIETLLSGWGTRDRSARPPRPSPATLASGARLFDEKGCAACHLFGNATFPSVGDLTRTFTPQTPLRAQAPDLQHTRDRLPFETIEQWIRDPRSVKRDTPMPPPAVTPEEATLLATFLYFGEPGAAGTAAPRRPPPYDTKAPVPTYEEVDTKVFSVLCLHCHEDSHPEMGPMSDGGPGNTGGFGFKGVGLSFESYATVLKGSRDSRGRRHSVFRPGPTGEPVLLERMRLRFAENERDFILPGHDPLRSPLTARSEAPRGMPLGLPAVTDEQFSLMERWVKGGHPGPAQSGGAGRKTAGP